MERLKVNKKEDASVRRKGIKKKTNLWKDTNENAGNARFSAWENPVPQSNWNRYDELELRKQQKQA